MVVLGIDPGFGRLGFAIIQKVGSNIVPLEYGTITTETTLSFSKRLNKLEEDLLEIIKKYKIDSASLEELYFNKNIRTGIKVAQARGVILNLLEKNNIPVFEYNPRKC